MFWRSHYGRKHGLTGRWMVQCELYWHDDEIKLSPKREPAGVVVKT